MRATREMIEAAKKAYTENYNPNDWDSTMLKAISAALALVPSEPVAWQPKFKQDVIDHHRAQNPDFWEWTMTVFQTKEQAESYGHGGHETRPLYTSPTPHPSVDRDALIEEARRVMKPFAAFASVADKETLKQLGLDDAMYRTEDGDVVATGGRYGHSSYRTISFEDLRAVRSFLSKLEAKS